MELNNCGHMWTPSITQFTCVHVIDTACLCIRVHAHVQSMQNVHNGNNQYMHLHVVIGYTMGVLILYTCTWTCACHALTSDGMILTSAPAFNNSSTI